jgi:hypothetical protein
VAPRLAEIADRNDEDFFAVDTPSDEAPGVV